MPVDKQKKPNQHIYRHYNRKIKSIYCYEVFCFHDHQVNNIKNNLISDRRVSCSKDSFYYLLCMFIYILII